MFDTLDEVPWNSVDAVIGPNGNAVVLNRDGFAAWFNGPQQGHRIPLDAAGPWRVAEPVCRRHRRKMHKSVPDGSPSLFVHADDETACHDG